MSNGRVRELDKLIAGIGPGSGKKLSVKKMVVQAKDYVEVIKAVTKGNFDLLVKSVNPTIDIKTVLFGREDTRLLHYCPCPVLVLKPSRRKLWKNILGAVDPRIQTSEGLDLNKDILDLGAFFAEQSNAPLHLLHVLEKALPDAKLASKDELAELESSLKGDAERKMRKLQEGQHSIKLHEHLLKGRPAKVIAQFIASENIDLLIMDSVARSGASAFLVGNTAEKIMDEVDCSLLVLKPKGWQTPIQ